MGTETKKLLQWLEEAKEKNIPDMEYVKQRIAEEEEEEKHRGNGDLIRVQIRPGCAVGGFGRFPLVCDMPKAKAQELADCGTVRLINSEEDIIAEDDYELIEACKAEAVTLRQARDARATKNGGRILPLQRARITAT